MKVRSKESPPTWLTFIKDSSSSTVNLETASEHLEYLKNLNSGAYSLFYHSVPMVYLLDYTTGKYLTMSKTSKNVIGWEPSKFLNGGLEFTIDHYEPRHLNVFNTEIFPDRLSFLKNIPPNEHVNYIFTYNVCLQNDDGDYVNLLQRNTFIQSDAQGRPLLSLGIAVNVNHFRNDIPNIQIIEKVKGNVLSKNPEVVFRKAYYLNQEDKLFSRREREVLAWMVEGLTSKEIADKLFISEGTVILHRKKMHEKSGALNVASLVAFAVRNQLI